MLASGWEALDHLWFRLRGAQLMLQATAGDGLAFDPFAFEEDALGPSKIDVGGREIVEALVISGVIISLDESRDLPFEISRQIIMLQQDSVLERLMPALDFALRHRMIRRTASVPHVLAFEPFSQLAGDIARPVVR